MIPARPHVIEPASAAANPPIAERHVPLIVVGAGPAGLAAALTAAKAGIETLLVDEHPVAGALMGLDVPFHFGGRMSAAVQQKARMVEELVETNPGLAEAFERGIAVELGTYVWGAFAKGPTVRALPKPMLGLADDERSFLVSFDRLVVAAGARDLAIGFVGWEKPGVMGAQAFLTLVRRYRAFTGQRLVVLGAGALGLAVARAALEAGLEVAAIVEVEATPRGPAAFVEAMAERGVPVLTRHAVVEARGSGEVESVVLARLDGEGKPVAGSETTIACDTVVMAIGRVPNVELLDTLGCRLVFRSERGGFVPEVDAAGLTSVPGVYAVGDCAGSDDMRLLEPAIAAAEGARAGAAAARGLGGAPGDTAMPATVLGGEQHGYWRGWLDAAIAVGGWDVMVCQCEEVTRRELVELQPPRYLGWGSSQLKARDLKALSEDGPLNQDQVKRLTRAGMGPCQGRRCREQVQMLLAAASGVGVGEIPLASYRAPVRPLPLGVLWPREEPQAMRDNWVGWFDIATQWLPHWEKAPPHPEDGPATGK
jgi:thioredoxin reductase